MHSHNIITFMPTVLFITRRLTQDNRPALQPAAASTTNVKRYSCSHPALCLDTAVDSPANGSPWQEKKPSCI